MFGTERINRDKSVDLSSCDHIHRLIFIKIERNDFQRDIVFLSPYPQKALLDTAFIDTDTCTVKGLRFCSSKIPVLCIYIDVVRLRAHGQFREGHILSTIRLKGNIAKKVDLPIL